MADTDTSWKEALTTRLGPFPAYVWGLGLGAVGAVFLAWRRRQTPVTPGTEGEGTEGADVNPGAVGDDLVMSPPVVGWFPTPATTPAPPDDDDPAEPETNGRWRDKAARWLVSSMNMQPTLVNDALVKFLDGNAVNSQEEAAINAAIRQFGPPPQGAPPVIRIPAPPVTPPPTSTQRPPGPPRNVRTGSIGAAGIRVGWDVPTTTGGAPISGYQVDWENQSAPGAWNGRTVPAGTTSFLVPVSGGGKFRIRVAARNARGLSTPALTGWLDSFKPPTTPPKPAPKPPPGQKPEADKVHTIKTGDILWNLVRSYYGRVTLPAVRSVAAYNGLKLVGTGNAAQPSPWRVGQTVKFPPASKVTF